MSLIRQRGEEADLIVTAHMKQGKVIPLDSDLAMDAAKFGVLHKLPLADSIIFATAQKHSAVLCTQDNDFEGLSNVRYVSKNNA
ncbi:type II toxin-antitoxin system VapC family toxin [Chromatiaceae bacterium AAb-1]|nr:type II toxin-antitoxin system VapC family toxin [Chromatiaceae bacterium AAb-1]